MNKASLRSSPHVSQLARGYHKFVSLRCLAQIADETRLTCDLVKNLRTKCEGLSPALFLFSIAGNTTYVLSILAASIDLEHLVTNAGWIAGAPFERSLVERCTDANKSGSSLTIFLDVFVSRTNRVRRAGRADVRNVQVLIQFFYYQSMDQHAPLPVEA